MGGTIARYAREGHEVIVAVVTGHGDEGPHPLWPREVWDRVRAEARSACAVLGVKQLLFDEVPAAHGGRPAAVEAQSGHRRDRRAASSRTRCSFRFRSTSTRTTATCSTRCRSPGGPSSAVGRKIREIHCYEVQSETHWNIPYVEPGFLPSTWMDIGDTLEVKLEALACYKSQIRPAPDSRSVEAVRALAIWRGSQMGLPAAEAFVTVRSLR